MTNEHDEIRSWFEHDDLGFEASSDDDDETSAQSPVSVQSFSASVIDPQKRKLSRDAWLAQADDQRRRMAKRWHQILPNIMPLTADQIYSHKRLVRGGIPSRLRPQIWSWALSIPVISATHPGEFQLLLNRAAQQTTPSIALEQIEKDLQRTFPNHPFYRSEPGINALRQTLTAFAFRNPHIGYSQSMNFVAGVLNLLFDPEKAFWMLVAIVERILPRDFYDLSLLGCRVEIDVLRILIQKRLPEVDAVLERFNVDIVMVCVGWYLPLFVNTVPIETVLRIWDCLLVEGDKVLFRISLALLKLHTANLQACRDVNQVIHVLTRIGKDQYDGDALMDVAFKKIGTLKRSSIAKYRTRCREKEEEIERNHSERRRTR